METTEEATTGTSTTDTPDPTTTTTVDPPDPTTTTTVDPSTTTTTVDPTTTTTTPTTEDPTTEDTVDPPANCGNGMVEGAEECDDGDDDDTDNCLSTCKDAECGDGKVHTGFEDCDDSNNLNGDGCSESCQFQACGAKGPTRGSAIAINTDDDRLIVANRESGSVSFVDIDYGDGLPALSVASELEVGGEPWQVAVDSCGTAAYVVLRRDQKVVKITNFDGIPEIDSEVAVGSEPTALALTPNGTKLYVANYVDGTLTVIDPFEMSVIGTVDLNAALVAHPKQFLGDVAPRPALAHPRAIAITGNGDENDDDEKVYVTEYFAQRTAPENANGLNSDTNKEGIVYSVSVADDSVNIVELAPIANTTFADANMNPTGCFPNQLSSVTVDGQFAYVTSTCASPVGPIGFKVNTHPVVSVIDTTTDMEVTAGTTNLDKNFTAQYVTKQAPDDASRRLPHMPTDIGFLPDSGVAYLTANGSDAVFRIRYDQAAGTVTEVGNAMAPDFINLAPPNVMPPQRGQNPVGIAVAHGMPFAFVANDVTFNVSAIDFAKQIVAGSDADDARVALSTPLPADPTAQAALRGKHFFNTGLGRWSLNGQAWGSCQACHTDGMTDNVTWYFGRGPRQSTSLDGSYSKADPSNQRIFNWTAVFDEMHDFEGNTRGTSGGVGALVSTVSMPPVNSDRIDLTSAANFPPAGASGLNGAAAAVGSVIADWDDITTYVQGVRPPRGVSTLDAALVTQGEAVFNDLVQGGVCQGCHGGEKWTISTLFFDPSGPTNEALKTETWDSVALLAAGFPLALLPAATPINQVMRFGNAANDQLQCIIRNVGTFNKAITGVGVAELRADMTTAGQGGAIDSNGYNPPSLLGVQLGAPFLHAGGARTLEEVFDPTFTAHWGALTQNANFLAQAGDVDALVAYLLSIDADKAFPEIPADPGEQGGDFCEFNP